jgi:hypothetical protein
MHKFILTNPGLEGLKLIMQMTGSKVARISGR